MIACELARIDGNEARSIVVESSDPFAALCLSRKDDPAHKALVAWLKRAPRPLRSAELRRDAANAGDLEAQEILGQSMAT